MPNTPIPTSFKDVVRNPFTYLLITVVSLLWYFVYANTSTNKQQASDCTATNKELRLEVKDLRKDKDDLVNAILIKNGIIGRLTTVTDSLAKR